MVRIAVADFAVMSRVLNFGEEGVIALMVNNVGDAEALVAATKFLAAASGEHTAPLRQCGST